MADRYGDEYPEVPDDAPPAPGAGQWVGRVSSGQWVTGGAQSGPSPVDRDARVRRLVLGIAMVVVGVVAAPLTLGLGMAGDICVYGDNSVPLCTFPILQQFVTAGWMFAWQSLVIGGGLLASARRMREKVWWTTWILLAVVDAALIIAVLSILDASGAIG